VDTLYLQLYLAVLVRVVLEGIADVERLFGLDVFGLTALTERYAVKYSVGLVVDKFKLDMLLTTTYDLTGTVVADIAGAEYGLGVVGAMRRKLLHIGEELAVYLLELKFGIYLDNGSCLLGQYVVGNELFETLCKGLDVLYFQREAGCIGVATEVVEQVAATLHGFIYIETGNRTC
jgi:hypothetical protein